MLIKSCLVVCFFFLKSGLASTSIMMPEFVLGDQYKLVPYHTFENRLASLTDIVNDPKVYPTIRDGKPWSEPTVLVRHGAYLEGNQSFERGEKYMPENFTLCWVLLDKQGKAVGRGGFQTEDGLGLPMTEVFFALKGDYQEQGLGGLIFKILVDWFQKICCKQPFLWLSAPDNMKSLKIASRLGFEPLMESKVDKQRTIKNWDKTYLVFVKP